MPANGIKHEIDLLDSGTRQRNAAKAYLTFLIDDYDPIDHLNAIFSHPSTLSSVSKTSEALQVYQDQLDAEIEDLDTQQAATDAECIKRIQASKAELAELFKKIDGVRERALLTEKNITEMTADIKQLDNTKKNLTLSMTALKRLQMLTTAYEQLKVLSKTRQYRECAQLLQAVIQLMAHFKSYRSIDQIATLSRNVAELQRELLEQVCEDFEIAFAKGEVTQKRGTLAEGCQVMDALGDTARSRLITWYCNTQLREYRQVFRGSEEAGSLDNISRRYSWFRRMLKTYDEEHAAIFPSHWRVNEVLANVFAEGTRDDYKGILSRTTRSGQTLDVSVLLSCLQETLDFEHSLERRFANTSRTSIDTMTSTSDAAVFNQPISDAFEPYLSVWVDAQDKHLQSMIHKCRQQPPRAPDEEFSSQQVVPSSTELFNFYRHALAQCAKLSTGQPLADLSRVFARYLDQYAQQVLLFYISERPTGGTPSRNPTVEDTVLVLNTADYCYNTCNALEEKIKSRIDDSFRDSVDLQSQADTFMGIASAAVRGLVRRVEVDLEPCWREMRNMAWGKIDTCADQSSFVGDLQRRIKDRSGEILGMLHKPQYARAFVDNFVELLANAYIANIVQCRPISEGGAEQVCSFVHVRTLAFKLTLTRCFSTPMPSELRSCTSSQQIRHRHYS
jgi:vacuolar protein sorting-associated protein 53